MNYDQDHIEECVECLLKAHEIQNDAELMKEVEPALKAKIESIKKVLSIKDLRKLASDKAVEEQKSADEINQDYFGSDVVLGEGIQHKKSNDDMKIPGKA